jgi:beta-lactamase superfamily II metal-dependent hydrolase
MTRIPYAVTGMALLALIALPASDGVAKPKAAKPSRDLKIISVDVEGGAAVLWRTPEGKSILIDTGWTPGAGGPRPVPGAPPPAPLPSSADRIAAAAVSLGVTKIDYLLLTHYHADHLGGLEALLAKLPVDTFVDHGPNREVPPAGTPPERMAGTPQARYPHWVDAYQGHPHISAKAGDTLDVGSVHIQLLAADGDVPDAPLPGAGAPNPLCAGVPGHDNNGGEENVRSLGMLITFGKTRIVYLGDLTWNMEIKLLCPINRIGKTDVYFVTGHGMNLSSSPPTAALDPLVAVMQNGPTKGGDREVINTVAAYPHLQGFWRTHDTIRYPELNGDPNYIANLDWVPDQGYALALNISPGGDITVTNGRNNFSKSYKARAAQ